MSVSLFEIATDRVKLTWGARGSSPHQVVGHLVFRSLRPGLKFRVCQRALLPELAAKDPYCQNGPALREQTDYNVFIQGEGRRRVELTHRDPLIIRDMKPENGGRLAHGTINFGSQVGLSEFVLKVDDDPEMLVEVEVFPTKLDYRLDYQRLLADVQGILVGLALEYLRSTYQWGQRMHVPVPTDLEWVLLLRHVVNDLERGLVYVAQHPMRGLVREPQILRAERVKRVDSHIRSAIRRGIGAGSWVHLGHNLVVREKLEEHRTRPHLNTPEHRWLAANIHHIRRRLAQLRQTEAATGKTNVRGRKKIVELTELEQRLARLGRLEPVVAAEGSPQAGFASLQLLGAVGYREAYQSCLALSLGLRITGGPMDLSVKDLSLLYEYWCYLALLRLLSEETGHRVDPRALLSINQQGLQVMLRRGQETRAEFRDLAGRSIEVRYNPRFSVPELVLVPQMPDMLITIKEPSVWPSIHLLLDAKYRVDASEEYQERYGSKGPPEEALNVLHRYRDAILEEDNNTGCRPGRAVVLVAAAFPHREDVPGSFCNTKLWRSFERFGIGAIPLLPENTDYLRDWLRSALRRGGWVLAERVVRHLATEQAVVWRSAAQEVVLVGVLRPEMQKHLEWIRSRGLYYIPQVKDQPRQYSVKWLALYIPADKEMRGAIRYRAPITGISVTHRSEVQTPWLPRQEDHFVVIYNLGPLQPLTTPIENIGVDGRGQRFSVHRWTSRLALDRAHTLPELLLETESEWRFYEELRAAGISFEIRAGEVPTNDKSGHTRFCIGTRSGFWVVRYAGIGGFLIEEPDGTKRFMSSFEDVFKALDRKE